MDEPPAQVNVQLDESNPLKRKSLPETHRQSESPKRARTERDDARTSHSPDAPKSAPVDAEPPRASLEEARARVAQEEKRRGKRLFGGLLGTLSQRPTNPHQEKRREIEKRQQERLKQQRVVEEKAVAEKKARIEETRMKESIKWEERVLHVRHSTLRSQAKFLRTDARPPIYYKPWIITADQKHRIRQQRHDAEDTIERELEEFEVRKEEHSRKYGLKIQPAERLASPKHPEAEKPSAAQEKSDQEEHASEERPESRSASGREYHDESNDVVVDTEEDVVIY